MRPLWTPLLETLSHGTQFHVQDFSHLAEELSLTALVGIPRASCLALNGARAGGAFPGSPSPNRLRLSCPPPLAPAGRHVPPIVCLAEIPIPLRAREASRC